MINANVFIINKIESEMATHIQEAIDNKEIATVKVPLGSFTGINFLSGKGPNVEIMLASGGRINTDLKSEFVARGINQTVHRIYMQIDCKINILTPFSTIEQNVANQVLFAENVILGQVPDSFYNFEGLDQAEETLNTLE